MFDLGNSINVQTAIPAKNQTGNVDATAVDTAGYQGFAFVLATGIIINGTPAATLSFKVGADTNISNATALDSQYIVKQPAALSTANTAVVYGVGALGGDEDTRYIFPSLVMGAANATVSVHAVLGLPTRVPTN
jgi:hypothetical protein